MKKDLSLLIIAKNEAENIRNVINSAKKVVNSIIVVDTGSSDDTAMIATRLGAEVLFYKWDNNFSNARNFGLQHISTAWVLALDADEMLDVDSFNKFAHFLYDENIGGLNCVIENALNDDDDASIINHRYTRIFRANPKIRYVGKIHEQIRESITEAGFAIQNTDIIIKHFGYIDVTDDKKQRNRSMLLEEIEANPNDSWLKYHLAETEFAMTNYDEAYEIYSKIKDHYELTLEQNQRVKIRLGQILLNRNELNECINVLDFQSNITDINGLRQFIIGTCLLHQKQYSKAFQFFAHTDTQNSCLVDKKLLNPILTNLSNIPGI